MENVVKILKRFIDSMFKLETDYPRYRFYSLNIKRFRFKFISFFFSLVDRIKNRNRLSDEPVLLLKY